VAAGLPRTRTKFLASSEDAAKFLSDFVVPGDLLLVKGSRGVKMERIVEELVARHGAGAPLAERVPH
jgi:UDP-N-acetylmuramoyl-tripeptide--D-alanyl-D-alanine ligase